MDDLISRQAAIEAMGCINDSICEGQAIEALWDLPSAHERKRGKWEFIGGYGYQYRCSACIMCAEHKTNYCPNCGADMIKETEDG